MAEAVQKLLDTHYYELGPVNEWAEFRGRIIWCYDISDILEANEAGLRKIFNSFVTPRRRTPEKNDMIYLMCKHTTPPILKAEVDAIYCYGMCKQAIIYEKNEKEAKKYNEIQYVEFMEFLCRCA